MEVESFRIDHQGTAGVEDHLQEVSESVLQMFKRARLMWFPVQNLSILLL